MIQNKEKAWFVILACNLRVEGCICGLAAERWFSFFSCYDCIAESLSYFPENMEDVVITPRTIFCRFPLIPNTDLRPYDANIYMLLINAS
jgi:hypothetical protein